MNAAAKVEKYAADVAYETEAIASLTASIPACAPRSPRARELRKRAKQAQGRLATARRRLHDAEKALAEERSAGTVDLVKIGAGKVWHLLAEERQVEETESRLAYVGASGVCGATGEMTTVARYLDPHVVAHEGASVCSRCIAAETPVSAERPTEPKENDMAPKTNTEKVSTREAIRLAFANGDVTSPATTADICAAAAKYASGQTFNLRHQLEATLHAQARKDDGVVVRFARGQFSARTAEAEEASDALVEVPLSEVLAEAAKEQAKPDPKPAPKKKRTRKTTKTPA